MALELMDKLHLIGVDFILWIQHYFKGCEEVMLFLSHVGDPKNAFLVYFPVAFFCHRTTGIKVMWAAVISEWLNSVFKWILFGQRPYWWVHSSGAYADDVPHLEQYRLTCETGPGSPSGHAMVTSSVMYVLVRCYIKYSNDNVKSNSSSTFVKKAVLWMMFLLLMLFVSLSRCFIATHFPHQVVAGAITGSLIGEAIFRYNTTDIALRTCVLLSGLIMLSASAFYSLVSMLGYDPMWSVALCKSWCAKTEWIHLDTTLFYATTRDASVLLSTGIGLWKMRASSKRDGINGRVVLQIAVSATFAIAMERFKIQQQGPLAFYIIAFAKYVLVFGVMTMVVDRFSTQIPQTSSAVKKTR